LSRALLVGIDLDNTLICYDQLFRLLASEAGLPAGGGGQKAIRDTARMSPEGDVAWQKLQGAAYGARIREARPAHGALAFLARCGKERVPIRIISHKTEYAAQDDSRTNLRQAALGWLADNGFFRPGLTLGPESCWFADTRQEKIARIVTEGCSHFIDDLEETFREPSFPPRVRGILYAPAGPPASGPAGILVAGSWGEIQRTFFQ